jgi:hypothetical protein
MSSATGASVALVLARSVSLAVVLAPALAPALTAALATVLLAVLVFAVTVPGSASAIDVAQFFYCQVTHD